MDNIDIAVHTRLNELAARHGLRPYDFVAVFRMDEAAGRTRYALDFEVPASGNALREERFDNMLRDIGVAATDQLALTGSCQHIVDTLDAALARAPRPKGRL